MTETLLILTILVFVIVLVSIWTGDTPVTACVALAVLALAGVAVHTLVICAVIALVLVILDALWKRGVFTRRTV